jgi:hypothetical protein
MGLLGEAHDADVPTGAGRASAALTNIGPGCHSI